MEFEDLIPETEWTSVDVDIDFDTCRRKKARGIINKETLKYPEAYFKPMDLFYDGDNMNGIKDMINDIPVSISKNKEGSNVIKGKKFQFVYNDPLPANITPDSLTKCIKYVERLHMGLSSEFPELSQDRNTKVHLSGNATTINVPQGVAALASADVLVMPPNVALQLSKGDIGTMKLIAHEVGHVFFGPYYPFDKSWGNGIGELFADFASNYLFPTDGHVYNCMGDIVGKNHNLNLFSLESLSYSTKPMRCYNGIFWVFYLARFGKANMKDFLDNQKMIFGVPKKRFWQIFAEYNNLSEREFGIMWLADCMTMGMFRDDSIRWAAAKKALIGNVANKNMLWKNVHNRFLELNDNGELESRKRLEAFGFMVFDICDLVNEIYDNDDIENANTSSRGVVANGGGKKMGKGKKKRPGKLGKPNKLVGKPIVEIKPQGEQSINEVVGPIQITVRSMDENYRKDDEATWIMVIAKCGDAGDTCNVTCIFSNSVTIDKFEEGSIIGIMHIKTSLMKYNASSDSAIDFVVSIDDKN